MSLSEGAINLQQCLVEMNQYEDYYFTYRTVMAHALSIADPKAHVDWSDTKPLYPSIKSKLKKTKATTADIEAVKQKHVENNALLREITAYLITTHGLDLWEAKHEIYAVIKRNKQKFPGDYGSKLRAAHILSIDTGHVYDLIAMNALEEILRNLNVSATDAFNKITGMHGEDQKRIPDKIKSTKNLIKQIATQYGALGYNFTTAYNSIVSLSLGYEPTLKLNITQAPFDSIDEYVRENIFTPKFEQTLANATDQAFMLAAQPAAKNVELIRPEFMLNAANHIQNNAGAYAAISFALLAMLVICMLNKINPLRPMYRFFFPRKKEKADGDLHDVREIAVPAGKTPQPY